MPDFKDIVGQEAIKGHLMAAIEQNKISHAYIISGERYSGKEFIAKIFAAAMLCDGDGELVRRAYEQVLRRGKLGACRRSRRGRQGNGLLGGRRADVDYA